jgi:hypothetical protein
VAERALRGCNSLDHRLRATELRVNRRNYMNDFHDLISL